MRDFSYIINNVKPTYFADPSIELINAAKKRTLAVFTKCGYDFGSEFVEDSFSNFSGRFDAAYMSKKSQELENEKIRELLSRNGDDKKRIRYPKGLFVSGPCGTGKTLFCRILSSMFDIEMLDMTELVTIYLSKKGNEWFLDFIEKNRKSPIIIDDLGAESDAKRYGNEIPISELLYERSKTWERYGIPTIVTSNMVLDSPNKELMTIRRKYGTRIFSRLSGMLDRVELTGRDHRKD